MHARLARDLRVERDHEHVVLARGDGMAVDLGQDLDRVAVLGQPRRADEDGAHRRPSMPGISRSSSNERIWRPNALRLHSVSMQPRCSRSSMIIPAHVPSTGCAGAHERAQRLGQPLALDAERHRRRLAAGHHQPVEPVEVGGHADLAHVGAEAPQHLGVCFEVALKGEDADDSPTAVGEQLALFELARLERLHRHPEALGGRATRSGSW